VSLIKFYILVESVDVEQHISERISYININLMLIRFWIKIRCLKLLM
jgi:hypothetical protein